MKKTLFSAIFISVCLFACSKDDDDTPTPPGESYMNLASGALRSYGFTNNNPVTPEENYTLTTTNRDTVIEGKTYRIFTNSNGGEEFYNVTPVGNGHDYYTRTSLAGLGIGTESITQLYLKDYASAGSTWNNGPYTFNIDMGGVNVPVNITLSNRLVSVNGTRSVNGVDYTDVRHVKTTVTAIAGTPPLTTPINSLISDINSYYAPRVGMIENSTILSIDEFGIQDSVNTKTRLLSSVIP